MVSTDWKILETEDFWSRGEYKRGLRNTLDVVFADTPDGVVFTFLEELMRSERRVRHAPRRSVS
ncbi:hypothetical protein IH992_28495 [Candidatus Poribacteria bacterium]|nr:hypothetical protein [Candidatus Poribacteria bacterium]